MPIENASEVVSFDADAACEAVQDVVSGALRSFVEFDGDSFNPMYVDDATLGFYDDEDHMRAHFSKLHSYVYLDLAEMDLFTQELFPIAERVEYITTALDLFKMVRIYHDNQGIFVAIDHDEPVEPGGRGGRGRHRQRRRVGAATGRALRARARGPSRRAAGRRPRPPPRRPRGPSSRSS
ncbi:MAG: hypothetical protein U5J98_08520 [Halobacteriales archaeon]|nr:hypothetical protein [Halobacteriales archaeon]